MVEIATKEYVELKQISKKINKSFDGSIAYIPEAIDSKAIIFFIKDTSSNWSTTMLFDDSIEFKIITTENGAISISWYGGHDNGQFVVGENNGSFVITSVLIFK